jgi:hypothetical protein
VRRIFFFGFAPVAIVAAIGLADEYIVPMFRAENPLAQVLRQNNYLPLAPPSDLMELGSLYHVDTGTNRFSAICHPRKDDLNDIDIRARRGQEISESLERLGRLATEIDVDFRSELSADANVSHMHRVRWSLTDVLESEIALGDADILNAKLMERPECERRARLLVHSGEYVCQVTKILKGTAEYSLDTESRRQLEANGKVSAERITGLVKGTVEARAEHSVVERGGRLFSGEELKYGVQVDPICQTPREAYFSRFLPESRFGRIKNFVLFRIVEPMLPAKTTQVASAQPATQ